MRERVTLPIDKANRKRIAAIKASPSYAKAFEDIKFLKSDGLRPLRLQLELLKPESVLEREGVKATVVVFGSARIPEMARASKLVETLEAKLRSKPRDNGLTERLAAARALLSKSRYYEEARRFGALVSKHFASKGVVVCTGGGPGIMEAANRGASQTGAKSVGLNITLPFEQDPNPYISPELCFQFHYFAVRKMHFLLRAKALVVFPGGYGTMDELFEALTLIQTRKFEAIPVILVGKAYWSRAVDFRFMADEGVVDAQDLKLFHIVETAEEALGILKKSMRV